MSDPLVRASADLRLLRAAVFTTACVALSAAGHTLAAGGHTVPLWTLGVAAGLVFAVAAPLAGRERSLPGIAAGLALGQVALHGVFSVGQSLTATRQAASGQTDGGGQRLIDLAHGLVCGSGRVDLTETRAAQLLWDAGLGYLVSANQSGAGTGGGHHAGGAEASGPHALPSADGVDATGIAEELQLALHSVLHAASSPMLLGHLAAALATGLLLRRGEAALWQLVRLSVVAADELSLRALRDALHWVRSYTDEPAGPVRPVRTVSHRALLGPHEPAALQHSVSRRGPPRARDELALTA